MPCITEFHAIFYPNGVKILHSPPGTEDIYNLLTPISFAHLKMGDGSAQNRGLVICTDSYTIQDVVSLINVFIIKYRLDCTIWIIKNKYRIYIKQNSMPLLRTTVLPYLHSSMLYKLKL